MFFLNGDILNIDPEIILYSSLGQVLKHYRMKELKNAGNELFLDLLRLPDGIYLMGIFSEKGNQYKKVVINH